MFLAMTLIKTVWLQVCQCPIGYKYVDKRFPLSLFVIWAGVSDSCPDRKTEATASWIFFYTPILALNSWNTFYILLFSHLMLFATLILIWYVQMYKYWK